MYFQITSVISYKELSIKILNNEHIILFWNNLKWILRKLLTEDQSTFWYSGHFIAKFSKHNTNVYNTPIAFTEILVTFFCKTPLVINVQVCVMALQIQGRK
jgi:hypothetical protein